MTILEQLKFNQTLEDQPLEVQPLEHQPLDDQILEHQILEDQLTITNNINKLIINNIKSIHNDNYLYSIFKFLKQHNIPHTSNNNGVFFNLNTLNTPKILLLNKYIKSILCNIEKFKEDNNDMKNIKNTIGRKRIITKKQDKKQDMVSIHSFTQFQKKIINYT